jgi:hypothetical protein
VVHDEDPALQDGADPDRLAAAGGERVGPVDRAGPQLVDVEIAGAQVQQGPAELVLPGDPVLLDEPDQLQSAQDAVGGAASVRRIAAARSIDCTVPGMFRTLCHGVTTRRN